jgi:predicted nucleic acid-binding protein
MKACFVDRAIRLSAESLASELLNVPYETYAPIWQQMLNIVRLVNDARREAGLHPRDYVVLRYRRRIVNSFCSSDNELVK